MLTYYFNSLVSVWFVYCVGEGLEEEIDADKVDQVVTGIQVSENRVGQSAVQSQGLSCLHSYKCI